MGGILKEDSTKEIEMKRLKILIIFTAATMILALLAGCSSSDKSKQQKSDTPATEMPRAPQFHGQAAGITWSFPNTWTVAAEKPMRVATYIISPVEGDADSAECAIFHFGPDSGGGTQANLQRWAGQFEQPDGSKSMDHAAVDEKEVSGFKVTTIKLTGTYKVSGPMMEVSGTKEGYYLLGAIVEGPQGSVFFKMTGPAQTMTSTEADFNAMIDSIMPVTM